MKRFLCLLLVFVLLLGVLPMAQAAGPKYSNWFKSSYLEMQNHKIFPSYFQDKDLTQPITRYEMCQLAVPALEIITDNVIEPEKTDYFTDATARDVLVAHERGIVNGYEDGTFQPYRGLSRQEFFVVLVNFCKASAFKLDGSGTDLSKSFPDSAAVASWAVDSAKCCVKYQFINGKQIGGKAYLKPGDTLSREEAMTMLLRAFKSSQANYDAVKNAPIVVDLSEKPVSFYLASNVRVRSMPSTEGKDLGTLIQGKRLTSKLILSPRQTLNSAHPDWYQIEYKTKDYGEYGYIAKDLTREITASTPANPSDPTSPVIPQDSAVPEKALSIVSQAMQYVGYRYVWGGKSPSTGFDCSGLVYYVFTNNGYKMNRVADDQMNQGTAVSYDNLRTGDLVFFGYSGYANHVGIYIGGGNFVHASNPSSGVRVSALSETYYAKRYIGARRLIGD